MPRTGGAQGPGLPAVAAEITRTEADGALVAPPDFKSGREAAMSPGGSIPSRFRQPFPNLMKCLSGVLGRFFREPGRSFRSVPDHATEPRLAGGFRSAASEGGSVRGSPCGEPTRLRLTSLRPRSFGLLRR